MNQDCELINFIIFFGNFFKFCNLLQKFFRNGLLSEFVSVSRSLAQRSVFISSDGGRLCRPYIIVDNGAPKVKQEHLEVRISLSIFSSKF